MRPVHAFFRGVQRGLRCAGARLRRAGARRSCAGMAVVLDRLRGAAASAGWFVVHMPTGFIPKLDRGDYHHLAAAAARRLAGSAPTRWCGAPPRWCSTMPGVAHTSTFSGRSGATFTNSTNAGADLRRARRLRRARDSRARPSTSIARDDHRALATDRGSADVRVHPAAGARHGRADRLLHASAGPRRPEPAQFAQRRQRFVGAGQPDAPASPMCSRRSPPARRRSTSTSTATRRRC